MRIICVTEAFSSITQATRKVFGFIASYTTNPVLQRITQPLLDIGLMTSNERNQINNGPRRSEFEAEDTTHISKCFHLKCRFPKTDEHCSF